MRELPRGREMPRHPRHKGPPVLPRFNTCPRARGGPMPPTLPSPIGRRTATAPKPASWRFLRVMILVQSAIAYLLVVLAPIVGTLVMMAPKGSIEEAGGLAF